MGTRDDIDSIRSFLEWEFCPPLDSSLVSAMCSDLDGSPESLESLRKNLSLLAAEAEATPESPPMNISTSWSASSYPGSNSALPSVKSSSSGLEHVRSPLVFLRAAFPDLPIQTLQEAIDNASSQDGTLDMESSVGYLLSCEFLSSGSPSIDDEENWDTIPAQKPNKKKGKRAAKPQKLVFGDVRHRQLMKLPSSPSQGPTKSDQVDPWNRLSSLAEYISTLVPIRSSTIISSFHSPEYPTAFHAVAAQINAITTPQRSEEDIDSELIFMMESMSGREDTEEIDAVWARKCVQVTRGKLGDAMDLYGILKEIKQLPPIAHLKPPDFSRAENPILVSTSSRTPTTLRSPAIKSFSQTVKSPQVPQTNVSEWTVVGKRQPKPPRAESIPTVARTVQEQALDDIVENRAIEQNWRDKRVEALRKASQHWQQHQDGYGRQVASYYAEEASRCLAESRQAAIEVARAMVVQNRARNKSTGYHQANVVDLHGMTREQAWAIVKEELASRAACRDASKDDPLHFITGKGKHSAGKKSILLPALQRELQAEGWRFRVIEAGLVVYGKV